MSETNPIDENVVQVLESNENKENNKHVITFEILKIIKDAQQQHGLRHGDYQRYRGYCSRRIRRLRKLLRITQGDRRHYKRKDVTPAALVDHRSLLIPLMQAERAWGFAMQLRQEANTEPRKKFHLIARLRKASGHALALQTLCEEDVCDPRTKLEAQAYVAWVHGSLQFELQLWKPAMDHLKKAQVVYEKLCEALPEGSRSIYQQRVEELNPSIRYCAYNIGDEDAVQDLLTLRTQGDLMANFDALLEKRKSSSGGEKTKKWRKWTLPLQPERVHLFVVANEELDGALQRAATLSDKLRLLEDNLMDCKDAIASLRDHYANDPSFKGNKERGAALSASQMVLTFLLYTRLNRTVQRNLLMAEQMLSGTGEGKKGRPQDLARVYEMIQQNLTELASLPGLETDQDHQEQVNAKLSLYKAFRCYFIAEYLASLKRWKEAMALYERAGQYTAPTVKDPSLTAEFTRLRHDIDRSIFSAHAYTVLDGEATDELAQTKQFRSRKPLIERLGEYREEPALLSKTPGVCKLPPEMRPIPCKPLFFDLALNLAEFPNLEHKVDAAGKRTSPSGISGFVKGFLGWGGAK